MFNTLRKAEYAEVMILFFIQAAAMAIWFVPLGGILDACGLHPIKPFAFASLAIAAFVSPLIFGAMADRHVAPSKVLRWLSIANGLLLLAITAAIRAGWNQWLILALIQVFYFAYAPVFSISTTLVFARLQDARKEFGPVRCMATLGWMAGALFISLLGIDRSALAGYLGATIWILVAVFTYFLPELPIPSSAEKLTWRERMGLDALSLLADRNVRAIFLTTTLFTIPLCAFYPYAPTHLHDLGFGHTSAWMSLGQITEVIAMFGIAWLLAHWRLKWILLCGLGFGVARFALSALDNEAGLLAGIFLHGASFVLVFITAQIFLDQHINPAWRGRAQALMTLMNGGVGNLVGYLSVGWWFNACAQAGEAARWPVFWIGLAAALAAVLVFFLMTYRGGEPREMPLHKSIKSIQ